MRYFIQIRTNSKYRWSTIAKFRFASDRDDYLDCLLEQWEDRAMFRIGENDGK